MAAGKNRRKDVGWGGFSSAAHTVARPLPSSTSLLWFFSALVACSGCVGSPEVRLHTLGCAHEMDRLVIPCRLYFAHAEVGVEGGPGPGAGGGPESGGGAGTERTKARRARARAEAGTEQARARTRAKRGARTERARAEGTLNLSIGGAHLVFSALLEHLRFATT